MSSTIRLSFPETDIAQLTCDTPNKGANVLSSTVLDELSEYLDQLESRDDLAGLIIHSGKPGHFIAGADLREFAASLHLPPDETVKMSRRGQVLFSRLSRCPFVTVAAVDGVCLGGGAELATWCDRRVFSDNRSTAFGFPEVKLGLYPGWGGTARAPRMVGLSNAVEMITGGESISSHQAYRMGWAADVVPVDQLLDASRRLIREEQETGRYLTDRRRWSQPLPLSETELGFLGATASAYIQQQTKGQYPAPLAALETMLGASSVDVETACEMEAEGMAALFGSPINAALINVFFLVDRNKKDLGVASEPNPREIKTVAVMGAGIMGSGIAAASLKRQLLVQLTDTRDEALAQGVRAVMEEVAYNKSTGAMDVDRVIDFSPWLNSTTSPTEIAGCDLVLEAIVENEEIKKSVYAKIEPIMRDESILASNTSTIPITTLAEDLAHPERFCGIHFFNPVRKMKLVEVIRGRDTSEETIATAVRYVKQIGKTPIVVNDGPGFLVNRLLLPYMGEALALLAEGISPTEIDREAKRFGMPMGPIALYDMVGLDTALYASKVLCNAFPDRMTPSPILQTMVKSGRLGRKTGVGFYSYKNKRKRATPDADLDRFLQPHVRSANPEISGQPLGDRIFLSMLLEGTRVLEEQLVRDPRDVDLAMIFGTGFPPFKGGLFFWADTLGAATIVQRLKPLESLGPRMQPTDLLVELAKCGGKFYELQSA